jgi:hypothetical protein
VTETHFLFISGSRQASPSMIRYARRAVQRAGQLGWVVLVGDNPNGIDPAVVAACDEHSVDVLVAGIADRPRNGGSAHGEYVQCPAHTYKERDRYLADLADEGLFIWNGRSPGTKAAYDYMVTLGKPAHITHKVKGDDHVQ